MYELKCLIMMHEILNFMSKYNFDICKKMKKINTLMFFVGAKFYLICIYYN